MTYDWGFGLRIVAWGFQGSKAYDVHDQGFSAGGFVREAARFKPA